METKILDINAQTTGEEIEQVIPFLDMQEHALEMRDMAKAVQEEQGNQTVLELHEFDDVLVLWSPVFSSAFVNQRSPGSGNSLVIYTDECPTPEIGVECWKKDEDVS